MHDAPLRFTKLVRHENIAPGDDNPSCATLWCALLRSAPRCFTLKGGRHVECGRSRSLSAPAAHPPASPLLGARAELATEDCAHRHGDAHGSAAGHGRWWKPRWPLQGDYWVCAACERLASSAHRSGRRSGGAQPHAEFQTPKLCSHVSGSGISHRGVGATIATA